MNYHMYDLEDSIFQDYQLARKSFMDTYYNFLYAEDRDKLRFGEAIAWLAETQISPEEWVDTFETDLQLSSTNEQISQRAWMEVVKHAMKRLEWLSVVTYAKLTHEGITELIKSIKNAKDSLNKILEKHDIPWLKYFLNEREDLETKFGVVQKLFKPKVDSSNNDKALSIDGKPIELMDIVEKILNEVTEFKDKMSEVRRAKDMLNELCSVADMST